jgi:hypothetical protein
MSLPTPNLDDRTFAQLVQEAREYIQKNSAQWTDLSPHDPGMVLVEVFAYLTETLLYRVNRLPEKAYVEFLRLLGVKLHPPAAAAVELQFELERGATRGAELPRGIRVTLARADAGAVAPLFITTEAVRLEPGGKPARVRALHCDQVDAEDLGVSTGKPGQTFTVGRPPIIDRTGDPLDVVIGVEAREGELTDRVPALTHGNK